MDNRVRIIAYESRKTSKGLIPVRIYGIATRSHRDTKVKIRQHQWQQSDDGNFGKVIEHPDAKHLNQVIWSKYLEVCNSLNQIGSAPDTKAKRRALTQDVNVKVAPESNQDEEVDQSGKNANAEIFKFCREKIIDAGWC